mmetsp:Transcript_21990/g.54049  ORF Transcript_21990/g.54049 Transcript_21990/m.54049 type:complete len:212 (-) Transcript_21990:610-1245(-)
MDLAPLDGPILEGDGHDLPVWHLSRALRRGAHVDGRLRLCHAVELRAPHPLPASAAAAHAPPPPLHTHRAGARPAPRLPHEHMLRPLGRVTQDLGRDHQQDAQPHAPGELLLRRQRPQIRQLPRRAAAVRGGDLRLHALSSLLPPRQGGRGKPQERAQGARLLADGDRRLHERGQPAGVRSLPDIVDDPHTEGHGAAGALPDGHDPLRLAG